MKRSLLIKGITLLSFVSLVTVFIFYRTGYFDKYIFSTSTITSISPNGGVISSSGPDTSKSKKDSLNKVMLPSSKVLILTEKKSSNKDSLKKQLRRVEMLSSSKSAIVPKLYTDTNNLIYKIDFSKIFSDSSKTKKKKQ